MQKALIYVRTHKFITGLILLVLLWAGYSFLKPPPPPDYETGVVERGDVIQEVSVTGKVESENTVELAFERGGRVATVPRAVGERVGKGEVLVRLDGSELSAQRAQAAANLAYEEVRLEELKKGARPEDIAVTQERVRAAESSLSDARLALGDKITLSVNALDDAVYAKTDPLFENPRTNSPQFSIPISDAKTIAELEAMRLSVGEAFTERTLIETDLEGSADTEKSNLEEVRAYLDKLLLAISTMSPSSSYSQTTIDGWKTNINSARSSVGSAYTALLAAEEKYRSALSALRIAENELALKKSPPTPETISAQEARIAAARATVGNYDAQIAKTALVAPFSGIITKQSAKMGETIAPNATVVSLISDGVFTISANVAEADLAKIAVGDPARVTLDAYGSETIFNATVSAIDPAETIVEGVSTYKVTLYFDEKDDRIRSGMTANTDILTDVRKGVLFVPTRAIFTQEGGRFVRIPTENGATEEVSVVAGLRGSDGVTEIVSGLEEGQTIVTFEER